MGRITEAKKIYDQLACNYFKINGWDPFIISISGKPVADIIAVKGNHVAIAEVKSPNEKTVDIKYDDTKRLYPGLEPGIAGYLREARRNISLLFPYRTQKYEKLYAITIGCQLYRYYFEFDYLTGTYTKCIHGGKLALIRDMRKSAFLLVPVDYSEYATNAVNALQTGHYITSYFYDNTPELFIMEIKYN